MKKKSEEEADVSAYLCICQTINAAIWDNLKTSSDDRVCNGTGRKGKVIANNRTTNYNASQVQLSLIVGLLAAKLRPAIMSRASTSAAAASKPAHASLTSLA